MRKSLLSLGLVRSIATLSDQIARDFDGYVFESETAGPVVQRIARYTF
jgi:hypothetical protein